MELGSPRSRLSFSSLQRSSDGVSETKGLKALPQPLPHLPASCLNCFQHPVRPSKPFCRNLGRPAHFSFIIPPTLCLSTRTTLAGLFRDYQTPKVTSVNPPTAPQLSRLLSKERGVAGQKQDPRSPLSPLSLVPQLLPEAKGPLFFFLGSKPDRVL